MRISNPDTLLICWTKVKSMLLFVVFQESWYELKASWTYITSWLWSCQTLTIYDTSEISSKSTTMPQALPYSPLSPLSSLHPSPLRESSPPVSVDVCLDPYQNREQSSSGPSSATLLQYLWSLLLWPPSERDRGWSQRLKVKPSPSRVLQIVLHGLRFWGFGAKYAVSLLCQEIASN